MRKKSLLLLFFDIIFINLAYILALYLRFEGNLQLIYVERLMKYMPIIIVAKIFVFFKFRLYRSIWEYASIDELIEVVEATVISNLTVTIFMIIAETRLPRSIYIMVPVIDMTFIGGSRFIIRIIRRVDIGIKDIHKDQKRILIVGAGAAGAIVIRELRNHNNLNSKPIALIDDNSKKKNKIINGIPVVGNRKDIYRICKEYDIDDVIIAIPSAKKKDIRDIVNECKKTKCKTKILPGVYELIDGEVSISRIRDVEITDLLGRDEIKLDMQGIYEYIEGKKILITGGGGSIGSELCRQIIKFNPKELIIFDIYENNAYDIQNELLRKYDNISLKVYIGSIRDESRLDEIFRNDCIDVIFHAAAHKHVPLMEDSPKEAIKNNVFGTLNVVKVADKYNVEKFVLISTDKAVNPTNVMGATKRVAELIIQSANRISKTDYVAVRFGNVLGSNGSVIPLFKKQIKEGGPVTVTHHEIIRYFMTIPEACQLVLESGAIAKGGEIFVLDMGEPVKIMDLAKDLIRLSGLKPDEDIEIKITGLRPGEKLYEEILIDREKVTTTKNNKVFIEKPILYNYKNLERCLYRLKDAVEYNEDSNIKSMLSEIVPTYKPYINKDLMGKGLGMETNGLEEIAATKDNLSLN